MKKRRLVIAMLLTAVAAMIAVAHVSALKAPPRHDLHDSAGDDTVVKGWVTATYDNKRADWGILVDARLVVTDAAGNPVPGTYPIGVEYRDPIPPESFFDVVVRPNGVGQGRAKRDLTLRVNVYDSSGAVLATSGFFDVWPE